MSLVGRHFEGFPLFFVVSEGFSDRFVVPFVRLDLSVAASGAFVDQSPVSFVECHPLVVVGGATADSSLVSHAALCQSVVAVGEATPLAGPSCYCPSTNGYCCWLQRRTLEMT